MGIPTSHRSWPPPDDHPWLIRMRWRDLLFMHWPVASELLRPHIPAALQLDTFDGKAWLGIVPFLMDIHPRCTPLFPGVPLPGLTRFLELNVRTYVTIKGKPGVWFFSLDAASALAVPLARRFFHLPYFHADMTHHREGDAVRYSSVRKRLDRYHSPPAAFAARYRPTGAPYLAQPGTLDYFFTERYCLYAAAPNGRLFRGEIHHLPWPLQPAECEVERLDMTRLLGFDLPFTPPLLHFAKSLDVRAWMLRPA